MEVEVQDHRGEVVASFAASKAEIDAIPYLMEARRKLQSGDPTGAFESLIQVCHKTNTNVMQVIDTAKGVYEKEQSELTEKQKENKESLLSLQGKDQILREAYHDGDHTLCCYCNALIAKTRYKIHQTRWCPALSDNSDEDSE